MFRAILLAVAPAAANPNGRPNSDVLRPWANGLDVTRRRDMWIIDFGWEMCEAEAALYEDRSRTCTSKSSRSAPEESP